MAVTCGRQESCEQVSPATELTGGQSERQPEEDEAAGRNSIRFLSCSLLHHKQAAGQGHPILRTYLDD